MEIDEDAMERVWHDFSIQWIPLGVWRDAIKSYEVAKVSQTADGCRVAFEKWCRGKLDEKRTQFYGQPYANRDTAIAWQAWQAAWGLSWK